MCTSTYIHTLIHTYTYTIYIYIYVHVEICVHLYIYIYICIYVSVKRLKQHVIPCEALQEAVVPAAVAAPRGVRGPLCAAVEASSTEGVKFSVDARTVGTCGIRAHHDLSVCSRSGV